MDLSDVDVPIPIRAPLFRLLLEALVGLFVGATRHGQFAAGAEASG